VTTGIYGHWTCRAQAPGCQDGGRVSRLTEPY
jgi:hypothetical protein